MDLRRLGSNKWLNDTIINSYIELLTMFIRPSVHVFNSHFFAMLVEHGEKSFNKLVPWHKKFRRPIFSCMERIIMPINLHQSHWVAICIDFKRRVVTFLDSLYDNRNFKYTSIMIRKYLVGLAEVEGHSLDMSAWTFVGGKEHVRTFWTFLFSFLIKIVIWCSPLSRKDMMTVGSLRLRTFETALAFGHGRCFDHRKSLMHVCSLGWTFCLEPSIIRINTSTIYSPFSVPLMISPPLLMPLLQLFHPLSLKRYPGPHTFQGTLANKVSDAILLNSLIRSMKGVLLETWEQLRTTTGEVGHRTPVCKVSSAVIPWMIVNIIMGSGIANLRVIQEIGTDMGRLLQGLPSRMGLHLVGWIIVTGIKADHLMILVGLTQGQDTGIVTRGHSGLREEAHPLLTLPRVPELIVRLVPP
jgi:hypothetical protein